MVADEGVFHSRSDDFVISVLPMNQTANL